MSEKIPQKVFPSAVFPDIHVGLKKKKGYQFRNFQKDKMFFALKPIYFDNYHFGIIFKSPLYPVDPDVYVPVGKPVVFVAGLGVDRGVSIKVSLLL